VPSVRAALIVQDDPSLAKAMSKRLGRMKFRVLHAKHFDAAVSHLATTEPHVVCIDVRLPSRSGYELCEHIRCSLKLMRLPIILVGEHGHAEELAYGEEVGGNAFLRKPFSMRHFAHCVETLLGTPLGTTRSSSRPMRELQPLPETAQRQPTGLAGAKEDRGAERIECYGLGDPDPTRERDDEELGWDRESDRAAFAFSLSRRRFGDRDVAPVSAL